MAGKSVQSFSSNKTAVAGIAIRTSTAYLSLNLLSEIRGAVASRRSVKCQDLEVPVISRVRLPTVPHIRTIGLILLDDVLDIVGLSCQCHLAEALN